MKTFLPLQLDLCCILFLFCFFFFGETPTSHQNQQRYNKLPIGIQFSFNGNRCNLNPTILNNVFFIKFVGKVLVVRCIMFLFLTSLFFFIKILFKASLSINNFIQCSIFPRKVEGIYKEYIQTNTLVK